MTTTAAATIAIASTTALLKKALDDIYLKVKEAGVHHLGLARSDIKESVIARALSTITKVKTLWNVEKEVSLYEFYYPSSIIFSDDITKRVTSLRNFGTLQNFVIQGTAGQGKSIFLRYLCGQELIPSITSNRVPLFVELRRVRSDLSVHSLILEALRKYKLPYTDNAWDFLANTGKFILLMDAFDEIDPVFASQSVAEIENIADLYKGTLQIIVTSRPEADIQRSSRFRVYKLAPLDGEDHLPFLKKICAEKDQAESLMKVLKSSTTEIRDLLTTPLMMTLLVILYKSLQTVPDTVPKFYEELFDVLFYRHDHSKPGFRRKRFTQLDDSRIKRLFSAFCFYVRLEGLGVLTNAQLHACVKQATKACNELVDADRFKDELIKTVCLMQQDGFEYSFIHKSVTQYYAASFVRSSSENFAAKFYELAAKPGQSWDLELRFLSQIDTYHYTKWYEIPLLEKISYTLQYSFTTYDSSAEMRINNHLMNKMSLMFGHFGLEEKISGDREGERIAGWSHTVTNNDLVLTELGQDWARDIVLTATEDQSFNKKLLAVKVEEKIETEGPPLDVDLVLCLYMKDEIIARMPDLGKHTLKRLQDRYDAAMLVIKTEDEKTAMLAALL
ncbi:NACHT domain-containing protein [Polaromonas sp.]|uniref:NACHT domain-containing protein n=1 Tax=Polaromonas sp. TaxID=1869339 RepID=UPI0013B6120E|nr:NACHT domain-containing protein [Polaromonas sp.]NDP64786.1 NACHT domain-containing protein [Polaromonas sp.]